MRALLIVDLQNDFMPGGALGVPHGDEVVPVANALMPHFGVVIATQDWHPPGHASFASAHPGRRPGEVIDVAGVQQVLWPDHCVQGTPGASLHREFEVAGIDHIVHKGTDVRVDSYSAFFDNARERDTGLAAWCEVHSIDEIVVLGLATDYCVKYTVLDALELGLTVCVVPQGCRAVDIMAGDGERALVEMEIAGATMRALHDLLDRQ